MESFKSHNDPSIKVAKSLRNFYIFFDPAITQQEAYEMPITTAAQEINRLDISGNDNAELSLVAGIKYKHPNFPAEAKSDEIFVNLGHEIAKFLSRSYDGQIAFISLDSDIK